MNNEIHLCFVSREAAKEDDDDLLESNVAEIVVARALQQMKDTSCNGETSLQNSFERAMCGLKNMPAHSSREMLTLLVILIKSFKENNIRVSIIGLAAEVRICQEIAKRTGGTYNVLLDDHYLKETLILNQKWKYR
ncbi:hypothetical protein DAPPUDRAFT_267127 [Daphnia pulex]|uniref:Ssl1-like domain-containing protein n=1 Tax=Daphnia pulex TaxID=6669 RepID=E9HW17_DAPPU|nr:hypothetical protein DAPPUDRAFT_267127 [Daphnia pulex]|eukprot:EFX64060.1 hypothetical protein DAPPUDRAFT_267127 [Daphnia pulex]